MNTQLITNVNFVELSFFKVGTSCTILSHIYVIICIYKLNLLMDSTKTHTAVPEQNSKLNIYVYTVYCNHTAISIKVVTDNSQMYNNMSAK